jgi:hypothetical protein
LEVVNTINLWGDTTFTPKEMFLGKNKLIVIGTAYERVTVSPTKLVPQATPIPKESDSTSSEVKVSPTPSAAIGLIAPPTGYIPTYSNTITKAFILDIADRRIFRN